MADRKPASTTPRTLVRVRRDLLDRAHALLERAAGAAVTRSATTAAGLALVIGRAENRYFTVDEVKAIARETVARTLGTTLANVLESREGAPVHIDLELEGDEIRISILSGDDAGQVAKHQYAAAVATLPTIN